MNTILDQITEWLKEMLVAGIMDNLANFDTWLIFKWILKTFIAVMLITNCFNITMTVFDVAQSVVSSSGSLISASTAVSDSMLTSLEAAVLRRTRQTMRMKPRQKSLKRLRPKQIISVFCWLSCW